MNDQELNKKIERMQGEIDGLKKANKRKVFKKRIIVPFGVLSAMIASAIIFAASVPHEFNTGQLLSSAKFNENFSYVVSRLWELTGSDLFYTAGNVGIGTIDPVENLHVAQNVMVDGNLYAGLPLFFGTGDLGSFTSSGDFTLHGEYHYEDFTLRSVDTLIVGSYGWVVIRVRGTFYWNGNINGNGRGGAGGTGGATQSGSGSLSGYAGATGNSGRF